MVNNSYKSNTISGFLWRLMERLSSQVVSFVVSIVIARLLFPDEYGVVALTLIFINLADSLVSSGIGSALIQKKNADDLDSYTLFVSGMVLSVILFGILFACAPLIADLYGNPLVCDVIRVMSLRLPIAFYNSIQQAIVSRRLQFKKFFYSTVAGTIISGILGIWMAYDGYGVWALVAQYISNTVINTLTLQFIIHWTPRFKFSLERLNGMISFVWKIMGTGFIGSLFAQLQGFVIGFRYNPAELAFYNKGGHVPELISANFSSSLEGVLFPVMSKFQDDIPRIRKALQTSMQTCSLIVFPLMTILFVISDKLILLLLTEKWKECIPYMQISCVLQCFSILNMANLQAIKAVGNGGTLLKLEFVKKPLLVLFIIIGMQFSALAIAFSIAAYSLFALLINSYPNKTLFDYGFFRQLFDILPILCISIIMGLLINCIDYLNFSLLVSMIIQVLAGAFFYLLICHIVKLNSFVYLEKSIIEYVKQKF